MATYISGELPLVKKKILFFDNWRYPAPYTGSTNRSLFNQPELIV
ncbi:MAG: hypothetical protein ACJA0N_000594 [Pseudohongiellaceae bacterium]|jgi:hypothetical protein